MLSMLANFGTHFAFPLRGVGGLLAQSGPNPGIQWAIVIFAVLLGLAITLSPSRRTFEIKRPKDE